MKNNKKAQFMIITIVLVSIAFFAMFTLIRSIDRSSVVFFAKDSSNNFENIQNAVLLRNNWIRSYWYDLNWENRTTVNITAGIVNPVRINPPIPAGINCNNEVRVTNETGAVIAANVSLPDAPCDVSFVATNYGPYYIYWNNPSAIAPAGRTIGPDGTPPTYTILMQESSPKSKLCAHLNSMAPLAGVKQPCVVQNIYANVTVNYSISYGAVDFKFSGFLN